MAPRMIVAPFTSSWRKSFGSAVIFIGFTVGQQLAKAQATSARPGTDEINAVFQVTLIESACLFSSHSADQNQSIV